MNLNPVFLRMNRNFLSNLELPTKEIENQAVELPNSYGHKCANQLGVTLPFEGEGLNEVSTVKKIVMN